MSEIRFVAHGVTLALAWFLTVNVAASAMVAAAVGCLHTPRLQSRRRSGSFQAPGFWLTLRLLPAALSAAFVAALFVPSYWAYEPREAAERFGGVTLLVLAAGGTITLVTAFMRGLEASRGAARRVRHWMTLARPVTLAATSLPAFEIDADRAMIALGGVLRPRLLLTRGLVARLNDAELSASVAHELGHRRAWDNLKRLAIRASPDVLVRSSAARTIERHWAAAAERAADREAASQGAAARCALASALVKVARSMPAGGTVAEPISTLLADPNITLRVRHLLDDHELPENHGPEPQIPWRRRRRPGMLRTSVVRVTMAVMGVGGAIAGYVPLLRVVHEATEVLVNGVL
jgi:Zn-dependent protease with chaperone function